ncbi:hypothetical protein KGQ20_31245 [Catenulispora sp. NF23]|uniref:Uncharacterized protein n=1 Tax=Catenulispora pinistramenti TaxID=2705254 RepID=A0ABS5KW77_9ACTN|nr:hypothetical protein [Catenulispora pinistramenti]MBS2537242.1 hypothetical protein [Catenulispora pinistramenti]MBS2550327.1 hypothetical protein [Catenulispora pinistramenti]
MRLRVMVLTSSDEEADDAAPWASGLWQELADLDEISVEAEENQVAGAKGDGATGGSLLVKLPGTELVRAVLGTLREWVTRTGRSVEVSLDGDVLKLTGASREQQNRIIEAWLDRHAPGA